MRNPIDKVLLDAARNKIDTKAYEQSLDLTIFMGKVYLGLGLLLLCIWYWLSPSWLNVIVLLVFWLIGVSLAAEYQNKHSVKRMAQPLTSSEATEYAALHQRFPDQPIVPAILPEQGYVFAHLAHAQRVVQKIKVVPLATAAPVEPTFTDNKPE